MAWSEFDTLVFSDTKVDMSNKISAKVKNNSQRHPTTANKNQSQVVVHDSTADCRYMILPRRPQGRDNFTAPKGVVYITSLKDLEKPWNC